MRGLVLAAVVAFVAGLLLPTTTVPTLTNGGLLLVVAAVLAPVAWARMRRMVKEASK